jgi:hypothetical protein
MIEPLQWALSFTLALAAVSGFAYLLLKAGSLNSPAPLIVALSMLTLIALLGALITDNSDAINLAAVGFGALAGSLAAVYQRDHDDKNDPPPSGQDGEGSDGPTEG